MPEMTSFNMNEMEHQIQQVLGQEPEAQQDHIQTSVFDMNNWEHEVQQVLGPDLSITVESTLPLDVEFGRTYCPINPMVFSSSNCEQCQQSCTEIDPKEDEGTQLLNMLMNVGPACSCKDEVPREELAFAMARTMFGKQSC